MIGKILRKAKKLVMAGCLLIAAGCPKINQEIAKRPVKTNTCLTEIVNDKDAITRGEVLVRNLPANTDIYVVDEYNGKTNFFKARAQIVPVKCGPVHFGIAGQYVDGTNFDAYQEIGLVTRVTGKCKRVFGKADIGYFPEANKLEGYAFLNTKKALADILYKYNLDTKVGFLRPGLDLKINKKVAAGIEGKFAGKFRDLQTKYVGVRVKVNF